MASLSKLFTRFNTFLLRASGGRLGGRLGSQSILILTTTGRRTGQPRATPLSYYRDGTCYLVVASNWGRDVPPDWLLNLHKQPRGAIQVKGRRLPVEGRPAEGDEQERLWKLVTEHNGQFLIYQQQTARKIPVVVLTPLDAV
jgi:deazaflavin-dependent oxidoreductase (nitroreductase family)